ncbi:MAG TPA: FMN-binding negative transcriptional regulator [Ilumatobacteraceae bacterium]|nr:FMN-binding negative transcriptional regulator [Ilumatobacteraceae bacterium]
MHVPPVNAVDDPEVVLGMVRSAGFGHLVTSDGAAGPEATALPFLIDDDMTVVRAHLARANPHWRRLDGRQALLIVAISDAYVSPSWYPSKAEDPRVVPTSNYEVVHLHGTVRIHEGSAALRSLVADLTAINETQRASTSLLPTWSIDDAPADFIDRQLRAIVGVELLVDRVVAKRKLSQNRSTDDRAGVIDGLRESPERRHHDVADAMATDTA